MEESKRQYFIAYLDRNILECAEKSAELKADDRGDEAVFAKVRGNIFEVFKTVFSAMNGAAHGDGAKAQSMFKDKLRQIPANWRTSKEKAEAHGDAEKLHTEIVKLEAVGEIEAEFERLMR